MAPRRGERLRGWVPAWWRGEVGRLGNVLDALLLPAELAYRAAVSVRNLAYDRRLLAPDRPPIPVISIGNLAVGGAGKTPLAAWIAGRLRARGRRPALVLRGYGADEVMVHRELNPGVPVIADARRTRGVAAAASRGCDVAVLDDAFQHRAVERDLDLVLIAAESWRAPRRLLPRGPWREAAGALRRADAVVVTRKMAPSADAADVAREISAASGRPTVCCRLAPAGLVPLAGDAADEDGLESVAGREVLALASLADPAPFVAQLRGAGAHPELVAYPDHHHFDAADVRKILARANGRVIVMTRKEAVKLRRLLPPDTPAFFLAQSVEIESGGEVLERLLRRALER